MLGIQAARASDAVGAGEQADGDGQAAKERSSGPGAKQASKPSLRWHCSTEKGSVTLKATWSSGPHHYRAIAFLLPV